MNTSLRVIKDNGLHGIIRAEVWDKREYALPVKRETYANTVCLWRVSGRLFLRERPTGENRFWGQIPNLSYYNIHSGLILRGRTPKTNFTQERTLVRECLAHASNLKLTVANNKS